MPRETLTRQQIVQEAVRLLDAEGLEGLNMRALGSRLGSAATAVYWHVGGKEDLIALAADQVWHELLLPDLDEHDWRTAATLLAVDVLAMLTRHPWLVQVFGAQLTFGPGKARHHDHSLAVFETAGFTGPQADQASGALFTFVLGNALPAAAAASLGRKLRQDGPDGEEALRQQMDQARQIAAQYPRLRQRLDPPASTASQDTETSYTAAPGNTFLFGLRALLDGLDAQLAMGDRPAG